MNSGKPKAAPIRLLGGPQVATTELAPPPLSAVHIVEALASGGTEEREAAYASMEDAVRAAPAGDSRKQTAALAVECVRPLIASVLSAPALRIGQAEWTRAMLLLYEMSKLDMTAVMAEASRKDECGVSLFLSTWSSPDNAFATMLTKSPSDWTRGDAIMTSALHSVWTVVWTAGASAMCAAAGLDELEWFAAWTESHPFVGNNPQPVDRYLPLALDCLDIMRSEVDTQPEGVVVGAALTVTVMQLPSGRASMSKAVWEAGFLDVFQNLLRRYNPIERISQHDLVPSGVLSSLPPVILGAEAEGIDVVQALEDAGAADLAISTLGAYQMIDNPQEISVCAFWWGALFTLERLLSSPQAKPIADRLRRSGVESVRYLLDHPLVQLGDMGFDTGPTGTRIAALVWGRDDDAGGLRFDQEDIDKVVRVTGHRNPALVGFFPLTPGFAKATLNLSVSDLNKELLLACSDFLPTMVDSLLLDPEHPRRTQPDFDTVAPQVQQDVAETIAQIAMFPPGREALLEDPTMATALKQVVAEGWTTGAKAFAESALMAMSGRQRDTQAPQVHGKHVMVSYQWNVQEVVKRIANELQIRGYRTWFDLDNMKGSTVDAMAKAVDNAAVMLSCISLAYKESSNCRLELQYGHSQDVEMIPLLMEKGYKPTGWLGLLMGTKLWYPFHPTAVDNDASFMQQIDAVVGALGERGKSACGVPKGERGKAKLRPASRVAEGVPPAAHPQEPAAVQTTERLFTPSDQLASVQQISTPTVVTKSADEAGLVEVILRQQRLILEREQQLRAEIEARVRAEACAEASKVRDLLSLQRRLEALHSAKLLDTELLEVLEDSIADGEVATLISLSATMVADGAFARQLKRKFT